MARPGGVKRKVETKKLGQQRGRKKIMRDRTEVGSSRVVKKPGSRVSQNAAEAAEAADRSSSCTRMDQGYVRAAKNYLGTWNTFRNLQHAASTSNDLPIAIVGASFVRFRLEILEMA